MAGDDRVRYCPQCNLNVYNFSAMTSIEIQQIVAARTGRLCARFYQRTDGTMLTKDCPVGVRAATWRACGAATAALAALVTIAPAMAETPRWQEPSSQTDIADGPLLEVVDPAGAPVFKATVSIVSRETGKTVESLTDAAGKLRLVGLSPGSYDIIAHAPGFGPNHALLLNVPTRSFSTVRLQLNLAAFMGEVVTVDSSSNSPDLVTLFRHLVSKLRRPF